VYCIHHQGDESDGGRQYVPLKRQPALMILHCAISQKAVMFILPAVRT
jgi:hypothetical protein